MKRFRRTRRLQRRGVQHVSELLSDLVRELDQASLPEPATEYRPQPLPVFVSVAAATNAAATTAGPASCLGGAGQATFAFYQSTAS